MNMYAKCGSLADVRIVLDGFRKKTAVIWSVMIAGYVKVEGMGYEVFGFYDVLRKNECTAAAVVSDRVTVVRLLQACVNVGVSVLEMGNLCGAERARIGLM